MKINLTEAAEKLKSAQKIIVTAHINPDGDAIGSTLAMLQILRAMNKTVLAYIDDKLPKNFLNLPCVDEIHKVQEGEKISADLLVILDTAPDRVGKVVEVTDAPILNIDHHVTNTSDENFLYVDATAAATCEIVFYLNKILGAKLTEEIAICLYTGLATDTGFFNYSNTKPATFRAAAELVEAGVKPNLISEQIEKRTAREVQVTSLALQTAKIFYGGKVVGMFIDENLAKKTDTTEGLIDLIRVIDSVDVAFLLTCKGENFCRVSMRSKTVDVSKIAQSLGGGGHVRAAGCTLETNFDDAKKILLRAIGENLLADKKISSADFAQDSGIFLSEIRNEE